MKNLLRSKKLLERLQHELKDKAIKSHQIIAKLAKFSIFKKAKNVLLYLPVHGEADLTHLFYKKNRKLLILPCTTGKKLDLYYVKNPVDDTEPGRFKLREPKKSLPKAKIQEIDLVLVPGIAFSPDGHRIGYGKGYYDRFLKKVDCPKIGIAYDFQIVKNIIAAKHDVRMDMIVTERRVIKCVNT